MKESIYLTHLQIEKNDLCLDWWNSLLHDEL